MTPTIRSFTYSISLTSTPRSSSQAASISATGDNLLGMRICGNTEGEDAHLNAHDLKTLESILLVLNAWKSGKRFTFSVFLNDDGLE